MQCIFIGQHADGVAIIKSFAECQSTTSENVLDIVALDLQGFVIESNF